MAHVVTGTCNNCRYTDCVVVCPVDCFYAGDTMLYIDPTECIDCEMCVPECPVDAIRHEDQLEGEDRDWIGVNAERSQDLPNITEREEPLATGDGAGCDAD